MAGGRAGGRVGRGDDAVIACVVEHRLRILNPAPAPPPPSQEAGRLEGAP